MTRADYHLPTPIAKAFLWRERTESPPSPIRLSGMNTPALFFAAAFFVAGYVALRHVRSELSGRGYGPRIFDFGSWIWVGVCGVGVVAMLLLGFGIVGG